MKPYTIRQIQVFQYEEILQNLKQQLNGYENEITAGWQSMEVGPFQEMLYQLQIQLQICLELCEEIANQITFED